MEITKVGLLAGKPHDQIEIAEIPASEPQIAPSRRFD
jgi:hypothetical protein